MNLFIKIKNFVGLILLFSYSKRMSEKVHCLRGKIIAKDGLVTLRCKSVRGINKSMSRYKKKTTKNTYLSCIFLYLVSYLTSYHEKAINALYELAWSCRPSVYHRGGEPVRHSGP